MNAPNDSPGACATHENPLSRASSPRVEDASSPVLSVEETAEIPGLRRVFIALPEAQETDASSPSGGASNEDDMMAAETEPSEPDALSTLERDEEEAGVPESRETEAEMDAEPGAASLAEAEEKSEPEPERPLILIRRVPAQGTGASPVHEAATSDTSSSDWHEDFTAPEEVSAPEEAAEAIASESSSDGALYTPVAEIEVETEEAVEEASSDLTANEATQDLPRDYTDRITVPAGYGLPPILEKPLEEDEDSDDDTITIDAGVRDESPDAANGLVHHGAYADSDLRSDDPIEIRRVMSLVEAVVQEQKLRSQDPLNLQGDRPSVMDTPSSPEEQESEKPAPGTKEVSATDDSEKPRDSKDLAEKVFRLPFGLDQRWERHQARVQELSQESNSKLEAWLHLPFELKPFPRNFSQQSESRQRSIRKLWRLEAETSGLMLTSGLLYLLLSIIWLLLPAHFLSIFKAQAAGQFIYQILEAGLVLLLPLTLFARYQPYPLSRIFGPVMPSFSQNLTGFLIGIPLGVLIVSLQNLSTVIFPNAYSSNLLRFMYMPRSLRPGSEVILWLLIILMPSLLEELFFRGNLFTGLYRQGYKIGAFVVSSLVYALLQQDPLLYVPFLFSLILCFVRRYSASLFSSILSHLGFRITVFFLYRNYPIFVRSMPLSTQASQAAIYASAVSLVVSIAVLIVLIAFLRSLKSSLQQAEFSDVRKPRRPILKSPGLRTGLLLYLLSYLIRLAANH